MKVLFCAALCLLFTCTHSFGGGFPCGKTESGRHEGKPIVVSYECDTVFGEIQYKKTSKHGGQLHGLNSGHYPNGSIEWSLQYSDGKEHGTSKGYYSDGSLADISHYCRGLRVDTSRTWYQNRHQKSINVYDSAGSKHGLSMTWYESGQAKDSVVYVDGKQKTLKSWYANGQAQKDIVYDDSLRLWNAVYYAPDGSLDGRITKGSGFMVVRHRDGHVVDTAFYKDGKSGWIPGSSGN